MEQLAVTPIIYSVPEQNLGILMDRIKRLQHRAAKLNSEPIIVTEVGHEDRAAYRVATKDGYKTVYVEPGARVPSTAEGAFLGFYRRYHQLTVSGPAPKLNDWTFVGAIDVVRDEEHKVVGNLVRTLPGQQMPVEYRTTDPHCDHCGVERRWKNTFVVAHQDGTFKQVGRQCMKDFTGHQNPESLLAMAEILIGYGDLLEGAEDDEWEYGGSGRGTRRYSLESILTRVAAIVSRDGWKPKAMQFSTVETLRTVVYATGAQAEKLREIYPVTTHDRNTARETLDWMIALADQPKSDYESNLSVIGMAGIVEDKMFGFVASAIPAYLRSRDRLATLKQQRAVSQYVGEVGKRTEMILTLATFKYLDGDYGVRTMMRYHDEQGNVIVWWASGEQEVNCGTKVQVKATVKKHEEFNGVKQTIVSRLTVLAILSRPGEGAIVQAEAGVSNASGSVVL